MIASSLSSCIKRLCSLAFVLVSVAMRGAPPDFGGPYTVRGSDTASRCWCTWLSEEDGRMPSDSPVLAVPMPHKHNADRRHHIPKMSFKVQNWPAYEAGLRRRGSLLLWIEDGALEHWQTCGPDGQARYTDAAIQTSLMLRAVFKLPLRQFEHRAQHQAGLDGRVRVASLPVPSAGLPEFQRAVLDPQKQAATPTQPSFISRPVLHLERHLWDVVTTISVVLVRHRDGQDRGMGGHPIILFRPPSAPTPFLAATNE